MKKVLSFLLTLSFLPSLCGCGTIYSNYREIEQMLVIQTLGLDYEPDGVQVSLASAAGGGKDDGTKAPVCLSGKGSSISTAMERIKNYSREEDLFFSHINHMILGEDTAKQGIDDVLSFICRSPELRIDIPLYIVKDATARETMTGVISGSKGVSELMQAVQTNLNDRGDGNAFTASDILQSLEKHGSALACAIEYAAAAEGTSGQSQGSAQSSQEEGAADQESKTAAAAGYAILKKGKLCGYIDPEDAVGVGFLMNIVGISDIMVKDKEGGPVTLEIDRGSSAIRPIWAEDGSLQGLDISAAVSASVLDMGQHGELSDGEYADFLTSQLEKEVSRRISSVLQLSRRLEADFLGLATRVELASPLEYRTMKESFVQRLPNLELLISVKGELSHTNDIKDA